MELTNFCTGCGWRRTAVGESCPHCGHVFPSRFRPDDISPKSFGVAVAICAVFGLAGVHHFYLGNILHGIFDLGLLIAGVSLIAADDGAMALLGGLLLVVDAIHSGVVMYLLFTGGTTDGDGRLVAYPGQLR